IAKERGIQGIVIAEVVIDETGHVRSVQILKPLPFGLDAAAAEAVRQWEFEPGTYLGNPVAVIYNVTVKFKLDEP
ncbi:MAG TPA: energy transducer TonB, partial [Thermoanaerobaculia bacterium]|nr:energy transducer TonB [Thermoanaerobaculia bacterium]